MKKYIIYIGILAVGLILGIVLSPSGSGQGDDHGHSEAEVKNQKWTCSMHPSIMQSEPGDCPICGMDLIPAESSAEGLAADEFKLTKNAMALASIETTVIGSGSGAVIEFTLSGKVKENEESNSVQTAHFAGRIEKLHINTTGEKVAKGTKLATIYSPELVTAQKELLTAAKTKSLDPTLYRAVRNKLKFWLLTEKQIDKIEESGEVIINFAVRANVKGIVTKKMINEGAYVKKGQGLFMISDLSTVWAEFDMYEKQLNSIKVGDEFIITTNASPPEEIKAKVSFIDPILNTATRTVIVRAELNNRKGRLKPGMFVKAHITLKDRNTRELVNIPKTSILWTGKRSIVYVSKKDGDGFVFEAREIVVGRQVGDSYQVLEGLFEGEEIVTNGTFTVDAAAQLQGKRSMMNPAEKKEEVKEIVRLKVSEKFQGQLSLVYDNYYLISEALAKDDNVLAKKSTDKLNKSLKGIDMKLLKSNDSHIAWMECLVEIKRTSKVMAGSLDITVQREQFIALSAIMIKSIETFGINKKVYKQFCPMANNDKGVFWLSDKEEIRNPFFGEMMLKCGNVDKVIDGY